MYTSGNAYVKYWKVGRVVTVTFFVSSTGISANANFGKLPEGYRPQLELRTMCARLDTQEYLSAFVVVADGTVKLSGPNVNDFKYSSATITYSV